VRKVIPIDCAKAGLVPAGLEQGKVPVPLNKSIGDISLWQPFVSKTMNHDIHDPSVKAIPKQPSNSSRELPRLRRMDTETDFLTALIRCPLTCCIENVSGEGDVIFSVDMQELEDEWKPSSHLFHSGFFCNFLGELAVRKNIHQFAEVLSGVATDRYHTLVNKYNHKNFGMKILKNGTLQFKFHLSLVQSILSEDVKRLLQGN
jgi:hypothetical protein